MGYNFTGTKPLTITEREVRLAAGVSGAYRKVLTVAQAISDRTGGDSERIMDWIMFHRTDWHEPATIDRLADEWREQTPTPTIDAIVLSARKIRQRAAEERAGRAAADDEARWSRTGW